MREPPIDMQVGNSDGSYQNEPNLVKYFF